MRNPSVITDHPLEKELSRWTETPLARIFGVMDAAEGSSRPETDEVPTPETPRAPGRPRNPEADRAILQATFDLMAEQGVGRLSMEGVAAKAGVGKSTIYRRWPSKAALVKDAVILFTRQKVPYPDTGTLRDDLVMLLRTIITVYTTTVAGRILPDLLGETARNPELGQALNEFWSSRRKVMFEVLERGTARGEIPEDIDHELVNEFILGPIYHRFLVSRLPLTPDRADYVVDHVLYMLKGASEADSTATPKPDEDQK
ncbi:MAG: TetR/AcrR family transcriptional regulator [Actinomycetota bacterium]